MNNKATQNVVHSQHIMALLKQFGVENICIAPGSRSTPLVLAALAQKSFNYHTHFDERGLGFLALGMAKASKKPVAIIVTSGTAVANLLPAVVEANLMQAQLILLTADRPARLIGCGANQAIEQIGIFSNHVGCAINLDEPEYNIELYNAKNYEKILNLVANALSLQQINPAPIHINCPFEEPLYGAENQQAIELKSNYFQDINYCDSNITNIDKATCLLSKELINQKGLIITGQLDADEFAQINQLNQILNWPLLTDPQSCGSSDDWAYADIWLQNPTLNAELAQATVIIQFGARLVSKRLTQFIEYNKFAYYWLIAKENQCPDPTQKVTKHWNCSPQDFLTHWFNLLSPVNTNAKPQHANWANNIISAIKKAQNTIEEFVINRENSDLIDEIGFAAQLTQLTNSSKLAMPKMDIFLGNSLIVRMIDMFSKLGTNAVFSNRGASGIDGLLASALGIQRIRQQPMLCVLGDLSTLHDLNSLALAKSANYPFILIICNNKGGAIFDILPVASEVKTYFYRLSHNLEFSHAAQMFDIPYFAITKTEELNDCVISATKTSCATIIELCISSDKAITQLKQLTNNINVLKISTNSAKT